MAAATATPTAAQHYHHPRHPHSAGRSIFDPASITASPYNSSTSVTRSPPPTSTLLSWTGHVSDGTLLSPSATMSSKVNAESRKISSTSYSSRTSSPLASTTRATLSKRRTRTGSRPGTLSPLSTTPIEPFPPLDTTTVSPISGSTTKIKPYLRRMSATNAKDDSEQGRLDLSKSTSETGASAGMAIDEFDARTNSDLSFTSNTRRTHARTVSGGSQTSMGSTSGSFRPTQPFVHPMRQLPRPFGASTTASHASSVTEQGSDEYEEAQEMDDQVTEDVYPNTGLRNGRSMSVTSTSTPPPLAHISTAPDLGYVPKITCMTNLSQSNLSMHSTKSSRSRLGRPRRDTDRSVDGLSSTVQQSNRTSLDKAVSFASRRSDLADSRASDIQSIAQDERIRAARLAFEEKEASKDRKTANRRGSTDAKKLRKSEKQLRPSASSTIDEPRLSERTRRGSLGEAFQQRRKNSKVDTADLSSDVLRAKAYDDTRPAPLPQRVLTAGKVPATRYEEKLHANGRHRKAESPQTGWARFSTWFQTRMLSCDPSRSKA